MRLNEGFGEHRGDVKMEPFELSGGEFTLRNVVQEMLEPGVLARLLFGHAVKFAWLPFEPDEPFLFGFFSIFRCFLIVYFAFMS